MPQSRGVRRCRMDRSGRGEAMARLVAVGLLRSRWPAGVRGACWQRLQWGRAGAGMAAIAAARGKEKSARRAATAHQPLRITAGSEPGSLGEARAGRGGELSDL